MNALVEFITSKLRWARVGTLPLSEELPPVNITKILAHPQRILIIPYNQMGTVLLATRVFKAIRDHYSSSKLSVIVHTVWSALVQKDPTIDEVISFGPYIDNPRSKEFQSFARDLASRQFDLALYFSTQFNEPITYLARLSEAKVRVSLWNTENEKRGYFNVEIKPSHSSRYEVDRYLEMMRILGIKGNSRDYTMAVSENLREKARLRFLHTGVTAQPGRLVGFDLTKELSSEPLSKKFAEYLLTILITQLKTQVVIFFEPGKKKLASELKEVFGQQIMLIEDRPVSMVAGLLSFCRYIVTLNTDLFQLAVALKIPTLACLTRAELIQWSPGEKNYLVHMIHSGGVWPSSETFMQLVEILLRQTKTPAQMSNI